MWCSVVLLSLGALNNYRSCLVQNLFSLARYVINMLKLQCHYASLGKFYKLNVWIVPALLYSKLTMILALPCILRCYFYEISRFLRIFNNSIIEDYKLLMQLASSDRYSLENSV